MIWTESDRIHQITRVLRLQKGESIVVFDGDGSESEYRITHQEKRAIHLERIQKLYPKHRESDIHITLYQALPNKHEKLEWIIQKSVEIGIKKVIFFRSDRSQKLVISDAKKVRYGLIAQEALEQCGGLVPLEIEYLDHIPENDESKIHIVLHPE